MKRKLKFRCTFDNPVTMAREFWVNGNLKFDCPAYLLWKIGCVNPFQRWKTGKMEGNPKALPQDLYDFYRKEIEK